MLEPSSCPYTLPDSLPLRPINRATACQPPTHSASSPPPPPPPTPPLVCLVLVCHIGRQALCAAGACSQGKAYPAAWRHFCWRRSLRCRVQGGQRWRSTVAMTEAVVTVRTVVVVAVVLEVVVLEASSAVGCGCCRAQLRLPTRRCGWRPRRAGLTCGWPVRRGVHGLRLGALRLLLGIISGSSCTAAHKLVLWPSGCEAVG
mmetsp:Transcript_40909/g.82026  ORF Transcript_40909/g.82026 Transcript_40909/m.82026 type:complete len:202 (+) Transcript_40909:3-608(+)